MKSNKNEKGFSLVELLVVVIIIAIVAAIAIPNLLASRRAANEASAVSSLRTIHSAEATYQATIGGNTDYANIADLDDVANGELIDVVLANADTAGANGKSGYYFDTTIGTGNASYCVVATPISSTTGTRTFAVSSNGVIFRSNNDNSVPATCTGTDPVVAGGDGPL
jgi:prepilin-type N-terminal cleavage/methylation domain-containing protein